jgi:predicted O-methyltransferase YrrM
VRSHGGSEGFLVRYSAAFPGMEGMFSLDDALLFFAYAQLLSEALPRGHVLEIGVHHGLSAIAVAALRGAGKSFVAVDLFEELQAENVSHSGLGNRAAFRANLQRFFDRLDFVREIAAPSDQLVPADVGEGFTFCHIDGGHSARETFADLALCSAVLEPGGLLALDDYFNPVFPGVCEGACRFQRERRDVLQPLAIGRNKVFFQKQPVVGDLNQAFRVAFPLVGHIGVTFWERPALLFGAGVSAFFDLERSRPHQLVAHGAVGLGAEIQPEHSSIQLAPGSQCALAVRVTNRSAIPFQWSHAPFGLSYHVYGWNGDAVRFENPRQYFNQALQPGEHVDVEVQVRAPDVPGRYRLVFDVVWEGITWLQDRGSRTGITELLVAADAAAPPPRSHWLRRLLRQP